MRKSLLLAAAGAAVVFTGCQDPVMEARRYLPAPQDAPEAMTAQPASVPAVAPAAQPQAAKFEPMTGVTSTGGVGSVPAAAAQKSAPVSASGNYYTVAPNDNPAKIAKKLNVRVSDLMAVNNMTNESAKKLKVGQKLAIPAGGKAVKQSASVKTANPAKRTASAAAAAPAATAAEAVPADGKYEVKSGDSPEKIARKFGVKLNDLLKANNLTPASARRLQVGQKLVIPGKAVSPVAAADTPAVTETVPPVVESVAPAASGAEPTTVVTESVTTTSPAATQGTGDLQPVFPEADESIESFARSHNVTPDEIRKLNSNVTDKVTRDMVIYLPSR